MGEVERRERGKGKVERDGLVSGGKGEQGSEGGEAIHQPQSFAKFMLSQAYTSYNPHTHLLTYTSTNIHLALSPLTERFIHREVGLDNKHGCPNHLALLKHMPPAAVQHTIDPTDSHLWALS